MADFRYHPSPSLNPYYLSPQPPPYSYTLSSAYNSYYPSPPQSCTLSSAYNTFHQPPFNYSHFLPPAAGPPTPLSFLPSSQPVNYYSQQYQHQHPQYIHKPNSYELQRLSTWKNDDKNNAHQVFDKIPEDLKLAREQALLASEKRSLSEAGSIYLTHNPVSSSDPLVSTVTSVASSTSLTLSRHSLSPSQASVAVPVSHTPTVAPVTLTSAATADYEATVIKADNLTSHGGNDSNDGALAQKNEAENKEILVNGKANLTPAGDKANVEEPMVYATKQEAKAAFKSLLESVNAQSDWTWEQTLKEIVHDKRYGSLRTLGERKQAFNEYLGQKKKVEAEERRRRQKKAREEFVKMLEECEELSSSMKWSKAMNLFENDERFKAVERLRDREDLFDNYVVELERKEREKALEEHVAAGILTVKTYWLDYCIELKELPQYQVVASNTSGSTPKDLFEDVTEELDKQYHEDKSRVKDDMKSRKISMVSSWLFEDFKSAISEDLSSQPISDVNLKLIYDDLVERVKEKEEKEARKIQRLAENVIDCLSKFEGEANNDSQKVHFKIIDELVRVNHVPYYQSGYLKLKDCVEEARKLSEKINPALSSNPSITQLELLHFEVSSSPISLQKHDILSKKLSFAKMLAERARIFSIHTKYPGVELGSLFKLKSEMLELQVQLLETEGKMDLLKKSEAACDKCSKVLNGFLSLENVEKLLHEFNNIIINIPELNVRRQYHVDTLSWTARFNDIKVAVSEGKDQRKVMSYLSFLLRDGSSLGIQVKEPSLALVELKKASCREKAQMVFTARRSLKFIEQLLAEVASLHIEEERSFVEISGNLLSARCWEESVSSILAGDHLYCGINENTVVLKTSKKITIDKEIEDAFETLLSHDLSDLQKKLEIETEKLLAYLVKTEMNKCLKGGTYKGKKFNAICHSLGYQACGSPPLKFDGEQVYGFGQMGQESRKPGFPILYGDGSRPLVLISAGVSSPKAIMIMYKAKKRTTEAVERPIYARDQDLPHLFEIKEAGATDAYLENAETSLQLVLKLSTGFGIMYDDVSFLSKVFRDSMEIQA